MGFGWFVAGIVLGVILIGVMLVYFGEGIMEIVDFAKGVFFSDDGVKYNVPKINNSKVVIDLTSGGEE